MQRGVAWCNVVCHEEAKNLCCFAILFVFCGSRKLGDVLHFLLSGVAGQEADLASAGDAAEIGDPGAGDTMEHGSGGE